MFLSSFFVTVNFFILAFKTKERKRQRQKNPLSRNVPNDMTARRLISTLYNIGTLIVESSPEVLYGDSFPDIPTLQLFRGKEVKRKPFHRAEEFHLHQMSSASATISFSAMIGGVRCNSAAMWRGSRRATCPTGECKTNTCSLIGGRK